ncbi:hypothetical protein [Neorhizobium sp. P12A]|uniref:hypothetical protein n=1 Tax=Neorhizobium sp. P12A TaxID=2268027 RepID=UPI0011EE6ED7|nr:hypothetical protein [Neorhizobium sp. P12A]
MKFDLSKIAETPGMQVKYHRLVLSGRIRNLSASTIAVGAFRLIPVDLDLCQPLPNFPPGTLFSEKAVPTFQSNVL